MGRRERVLLVVRELLGDAVRNTVGQSVRASGTRRTCGSPDRCRHGEARIDATINAHVRGVRRRLAAEPDLAGRVATGEPAGVAARYELCDQQVRTLS
ncbi:MULTISPECIES: hypothetical protein [Streptomyces]|uniref:hypothetical protein n=1 Tax=Streptomyces TaxID=1883 RepID=UPI0016008AD9